MLTAPAFDIAFVWGVLAAGCVLCLLDALIGPALLWIKYETPPSHLLREVILPPLPSDAIGVLTAVATSFVTVVFNPAAALTLFGGGALSLITMNLVREHREKRRLLEAENAWLRDGLRTLTSSSLLAWCRVSNVRTAAPPAVWPHRPLRS